MPCLCLIRLSMSLVSGVDISGYDLVERVEDTDAARRKGETARVSLSVARTNGSA